MDFYPPSYHKNYNRYKSKVIERWVNRGLIYHNLDELYEVYLNTMNCQHCGKEFLNSQNRCLDHDHETGLFRKILCQACNNKDCHLRYIPGLTGVEKHKIYKKEWYENNKDKVKETKKKYNSIKVKCFFCSNELLRASLTKHYKRGACPMIKPK
jgi:hypothetical protein